jgi:hypothetical protein
MTPLFRCETCDEPIHDYADIMIHRAQTPSDHAITRRNERLLKPRGGRGEP